MKWKVRYEEYSRHGEGDTCIDVVEGESEKELMNKVLELVGKEQSSEVVTLEDGSMEYEVEEVESMGDFLGIVGECDGDDRVIYVYDMDNKEFIYED